MVNEYISFSNIRTTTDRNLTRLILNDPHGPLLLGTSRVCPVLALDAFAVDGVVFVRVARLAVY